VARHPWRRLHTSASLTNQGTGTPDNDLALELNISPIKGDLIYEGQPLNIQFNKPTSQAASTLFLASVASRTYQSIASTAAGVTSTTTGSNFTASTAIDISTLRTRRGVRLRVDRAAHDDHRADQGTGSIDDPDRQRQYPLGGAVAIPRGLEHHRAAGGSPGVIIWTQSGHR
jgi:hypothetical protein